MAGKKAQIAMEYLILTGFILVAVGIIFTFSFINYTENIRIVKASEVLAKIANAVDDVHTSGKGNTRFVDISFPDAMTDLKIVNKCDTLSSVNQGTAEECFDGVTDPELDHPYDYVEFSAISMKIQLLSGETEILRETKAKIFSEDGSLGEMSLMDEAETFNKYSGSFYTAKVSWENTDQGWMIKLEKV